MDVEKVGTLIFQLRKERNLTQKELADKLNISNKTISKWECGKGAPDSSMWQPLSNILGADLLNLLQGKLEANPKDIGKIDRIKFYVCKSCKNILISTGDASISCCGRNLKPLSINSKSEEFGINIAEYDQANYISFEHSMTKEDYLLFACYVYEDRFFLNRFYPEQTPAFYLPDLKLNASLYVYSVNGGLSKYLIKNLL
ncbi:helix-turn-helix domain-containing protein [Floricoccus penangensis]|uniref:helix-turn-helix domain-containing protein n=1 Tax=Floricoccus penangensis TaxID=1859475 RepID=UPI00204139E7|nr:helix-turn-helix transcriptional regulator [Floricoccus penangensis]URZ87090.1 helix-turn-helix transcriptional regulator [Floricoccus penangensis]